MSTLIEGLSPLALFLIPTVLLLCLAAVLVAALPNQLVGKLIQRFSKAPKQRPS